MSASPTLDWHFRQDFDRHGRYEIPYVARQSIELVSLKLIRFSSIVRRETRDRDATVHFFERDDRFDEVWHRPDRYLAELRQYQQLTTPDFSLDWNAPLSFQLFNTFRSRWCGWYWQQHGLTVIPTVSWSDRRSFEFCFQGLPIESVLAVSTVGCRDRREPFLVGYNEMLRHLHPSTVICYGEPFDDMQSDYLVVVPYSRTSRVSSRR